MVADIGQIHPVRGSSYDHPPSSFLRGLLLMTFHHIVLTNELLETMIAAAIALVVLTWRYVKAKTKLRRQVIGITLIGFGILSLFLVLLPDKNGLGTLVLQSGMIILCWRLPAACEWADKQQAEDGS
jgi:hypothetical protein